MFEHLSNPEYMHVLLNPLPVYGLAMGVLGLLIGLIFNTKSARVTALALVFIGGISAWPVYHYGEEGYDRVLSMADRDGVKWLDEHMRRAEKLIYVFYVVAGVAAVAIASEFKFPRAARPLAVATLVLAGSNLAVGGFISYAGGHVRHREFRYEPPPEKIEAEEHHHGGADEHMEHAAKSDAHDESKSGAMDHGAMPGMQSPAPSPNEHAGHDEAASPPAPTSDEEQKQLEASRHQLEASRLQLEASRKQLEATEGAKGGTASPSPSPSPSPHADEHKHEHQH